MSCKWVLRIKRNNVYKARLVARGFEQKPGIDYCETYAPVINDLLIAGSDDSEVGVVIQLLRNEFEMSKAEVANEFLGISFEYSQNKLSLGQKAYVEKVLNKFRMTDCKPSGTPLVPKSTSSDFMNGKRFHGPYRELVGALLYLSMTTRPDILYSVNCLSQIQEQPTDSAWTGLKRILRYLKGTSELQLLFCKSDSDNIMINVYVDADWGADTYDRKSISGYIIFFNDCPVIWSVKKQTSIALSSTEAEILALAKAFQDLIVLYNVTKEILGVDNIIVSVYEDNQSAIKVILNENNCARLKHLDIKLKYVRDIIKLYNIDLVYVSTENQLDDLFIKCLPKPRLC
ncbi:Copia protein [Araneus ventricosus]|uniref:Copia protein n=1 Tax=Araneus ventricosus TaxID=182803 RepID=A0A4Y2HZW2_ARAVE|nr:Copia protein [Araneus ventricosus]